MEEERSLLNKVGFSCKIQKSLWAEAAQIATLLDLITVKPGKTKCPHKLFFWMSPNWARYRCTCGKVRIVKSAKTIQNKLDNKGCLCIFVHYPSSNHASNVYWFFTTETNHIICSCDVQWMNQLWHKYTNSQMHQPTKSNDEMDNTNPYSVLYDSDDTDVNNTQNTSIDNPSHQRYPYYKGYKIWKGYSPHYDAYPSYSRTLRIKYLLQLYHWLGHWSGPNWGQHQTRRARWSKNGGTSCSVPRICISFGPARCHGPPRFNNAYFAPDPTEVELKKNL